MPTIIKYDQVRAQAGAQGLRSLYHNSGAFGFAPNLNTYVRGWLGPADPTIRSEARSVTRPFPAPYEASLSSAVLRMWEKRLTGPLWLMPKSHWSYELQFGNHAWLGSALERIRVDPTVLAALANAAAVEFAGSETSAAGQLISQLLLHLQGSDFALAFPGHPVVCTVHHHKQVWWVTSVEGLARELDDIAERSRMSSS